MFCDIDNDAFDQYIEIDPVDSENGYNNIGDQKNISDAKPVKAKKIQFNRINDFMRENEESLVDKESYKVLWSTLTDELNAMGPAFTECEWKSKWSHHKYNKKRNQQNHIFSDNQLEHVSKGSYHEHSKKREQTSNDLLDNQNEHDLQQDQPQQHIQTDSVIEVDFSNIEQLLCTVVENQKILIEKQDVIIKHLEKF